MAKRFSMVVLMMILAIIALLIAAKHPTGPNTISYDEPVGFWLSIGMLIMLYVPLFILSFFNHFAVKVISAVYQVFFIVLVFLGFILVGLIIPTGGFWISTIGLVGTIIGIWSIIVTISAGSRKKE